MNKNIIRKIPAIVILLMIFFLSSLSESDLPRDPFELSDKLKHFAAYFILGLSFCLWFSREKWLTKPVICGISVVIICAVCGIFDEFHQSFVPGRSGNDLGDLTANIIGSLLSPFAYFAIIYRRRENKATAV